MRDNKMNKQIIITWICIMAVLLTTIVAIEKMQLKYAPLSDIWIVFP
jgi:hypothetical protein